MNAWTVARRRAGFDTSEADIAAARAHQHYGLDGDGQDTPGFHAGYETNNDQRNAQYDRGAHSMQADVRSLMLRDVR